MRSYHPFANLFSLLEGDAFDDLVADIAAHGVHNPIAIHEGKILEGRNRAPAAEKAGKVCPEFPFDGDDEAALAFVISQNMLRPHLTVGQRALIAVSLKAQFEIEAAARKKAGKPSPESGRRSDAQAAAAMGIGKDSINKAEKLLKEEHPRYAELVRDGTMTLNEFQSQDDQVKQFLVAIKVFDESIKGAALTKRKFSPEAVRFTKRKLEKPQEHIETFVATLATNGAAHKEARA